MEQVENNPAPKIWSPEGFCDDNWLHSESFDLDQPVILPLAVYLSLDEETRKSKGGLIGVELLPGDELREIAAYLDILPIVALAFPAFADGRSFSKAQLLRSRYGYGGIIRATGEVLIDQIPHMLRTGINEFAVVNETALKRLEEGRIGGLPGHYQPAAGASGQAETYSWRRVPA